MAILVKSDSARNFEDLPPTQRCMTAYQVTGCNRKRFSSAASFKKEEDPVIRGGRVGPHCRNCGTLGKMRKGFGRLQIRLKTKGAVINTYMF